MCSTQMVHMNKADLEEKEEKEVHAYALITH